MLLVTVEAWRPDRLALYGGPVKSDAIGRTGADGIVFDNAFSVAPLSRPSAATVLSGYAPDRHAVRDAVADQLPAEVATLAERLSNDGWSTAAFAGSQACGWGSGLDRGFKIFDAPDELAVGPGRFVPPSRPAADVARNAVTWLGMLPANERAFAWVNMSELQSAPFADDDPAKVTALYDGGLLKVDEAIGMLLDAVAKRADAEILVLGTHGVYLGDVGRVGDAFWLDDATLRVPLLWSGGRAAAQKGSRRSDQVWLPDVAATIAASAGVSLGPDAEGIDLGATTPPDRVIRAWSWAPDDQLAWPTLAAVRNATGWSAASERLAAPRARKLSDGARKRIEATGITLGTTPKEWPKRPEGADGVLAKLGRARLLTAESKVLRSRAITRALLSGEPDNLAVMCTHLFGAYGATEQKPVQQIVERLLRLYPDRQEALHWVAHYELAAKRLDRAEALTLAAAEIGPKDADLLYDLACASSLANDVPAAADSLKQAIQAGYRNWDWMDRDSDLAALRADPAYAELRRSVGR